MLPVVVEGAVPARQIEGAAPDRDAPEGGLAETQASAYERLVRSIELGDAETAASVMGTLTKPV